MNFSGNMRLMIILKVTNIFGKTTEDVKLTPPFPPPAFEGLKKCQVLVHP